MLQYACRGGVVVDVRQSLFAEFPPRTASSRREPRTPASAWWRQRSGNSLQLVRYCAMSSDGKSITAPSDNALARALARWENEGGATLTPEEGNDGHDVLSLAEQRILQCL